MAINKGLYSSTTDMWATPQAWVVNAVLWCFMLWEMFNAICDKLDAIAMGVHAILFGKVEEVVIKTKADDEPKAEPEQK